MGRKRSPGLYKRNGIWHIDKQIRGRRLCESTGERNLAKAEHYLARKTEEVRQALLYGVRPKRSFRQAATKYLKENCQKRSIADDAMHLRQLDPYIGSLFLETVHMGMLRPFIAARQAQGMKSKTINAALAVIRHMLNLAASEWVDENNLAWLQSPPKIKLLAVTDARLPYPLSWGEQARLFRELPPHVARMALFKVNTGCREQEVCQLRWKWEVPVPELGTSVFIIPSECVKNREERLIVLNEVARSVIDAVRGMHSEFVFVHRGKPVARMNNTAWQRARVHVGLPQVRVHDLKHTFGRRLYSGPELGNLIAAANKVCREGSRKSPALVLLRRGSGA
jgi:integrase